MRFVTCDIETTGLPYHSDFLIGAMKESDGKMAVFHGPEKFNIQLVDHIKAGANIVWHNSTCFDYPLLCYHDLSLLHVVKGYFYQHYDTLIISKYLFPLRFEHSLASWGVELENKKFKLDFSTATQDDLEKRVTTDVLLNEELFNHFLKQGFPKVVPSYKEVQLFNSVVTEMLAVGLPLDKKEVSTAYSRLSVAMARQKNIVKRELGKFNFGSRKQVHTALTLKYGKGLQSETKPNKKGRIFTTYFMNAKNRPFVEQEFPILKHVFNTSDLKGQRDYLDPSNEKKYLSRYTYRSPIFDEECVYPKFNPVEARTFRSSYSMPPLNQVSRSVREIVKAYPGWLLVGGDIAGLELRTFAYLTYKLFNDYRMQEEIDTGVNPKEKTIEIFGDLFSKAVIGPGKTISDLAKTVNYSVMFGIGMKKLVANLGLDSQYTNDVTRLANDRFPGLRELFRFLKSEIRNGMIRNIFGFDVPTPEYCVVNTMIQSSGAHYAKTVLAHWTRRVQERYEAYPVLFNHDEMQLMVRTDVKKSRVEDNVSVYAAIAQERAEKSLGVYLGPIETMVGKSWNETH